MSLTMHSNPRTTSILGSVSMVGYIVGGSSDTGDPRRNCGASDLHEKEAEERFEKLAVT